MTTLLEFFQQGSFVWKIGPLLLIPFLVIVLGELIDSLERRGNPLVRSVRTIRHVVLPILGILLLMRYIFGIGDADVYMRVVMTAFWLSVIIAALTLLNNVLRFAEINPASLWSGMPRFFFAVARTGVILGVVSYVLSAVWKVDLGQVAKTAGLGSFVIALALQDTLSSLFSGLLLIADRPFKIGDWIQHDGRWLQVMDINWRAVRLRGRDGTVTVVPNGLLAKEMIQNAGPDDAPYRMVLSISFYDEDPTNVVKQVLMDILTTTEGVLKDPEPEVLTKSFGAFEIAYEMWFSIRFEDYLVIPDRIQSRIFYAAKRHKLTTSPIELRHTLDYSQVQQDDAPEHIQSALRAVPLLNGLDDATLGELSQAVVTCEYGAGEQIICQDTSNVHFFSIRRGRAILSVFDGEGRTHEIAHLGPGDFFGEMTVLRAGPSPVSVTAINDLQSLTIHHETIGQLFRKNPGFALKLNDFVEKRRKAIREVIGTETNGRGTMARDRWIDMLAERNGEAVQERQEG